MLVGNSLDVAFFVPFVCSGINCCACRLWLDSREQHNPLAEQRFVEPGTRNAQPNYCYEMSAPHTWRVNNGRYDIR
jgi:hypothetical protein